MTFDAESSESEGLFLAVFSTLAKGQDGVRRFRGRISVPIPFPVPHLRTSKTPQLYLPSATTLNRFGTWSKSTRKGPDLIDPLPRSSLIQLCHVVGDNI